jgi:hypothetical protein
VETHATVGRFYECIWDSGFMLFLGRHPLSDASYWNPDMAIREQGSGRHRLSGAPYWNPNMMTIDRVIILVTRCIGARM